MRTTIDQHISDLLYYHECVVVPGFGAFLTRYFSAEVHTATSMMRPPSRRVAFNSRINENDGLLAKHVSKVEGVSYQKALESIDISVRSWQRILRSGKKINLFGVGRLFLDESDLLQFNPAHDINYNIKSYGLNIFRATAMEREKQIKRSVNRAIENRGKSSKQKMTNSGKEENSKKNWVKWAAVLGPVAALLLVGSYMYVQERETFNNAAGYITNIFSDSDKQGENDESSMVDSLGAGEDNQGTLPDDKTTLDSTYDPDEKVFTTTDTKKDFSEDLYNVKNRSAKERAADGGAAAEMEKSSAPKTAETTDSDYASGESNGEVASFSQPDYQIIVGSFSKEQNAQQYISALKGRGYDAYLAGKFGMYNRVAVGKFSSQQAAMTHLQEIREQVNYNAWLNDN